MALRLASRRLGTVTRMAGRIDRAATPPPDATPPVISAPASGGISDTAAALSWTTNEVADTQVEYGTDDTYGTTTTLASTLTTDHVVNLTGLDASTTYHWRARSRDASGNLALSDDQTFDTIADGADTTGPVLSSLLQPTTDTTATPHCRTDELAKVTVDYGLTSSYGASTPQEADFTLVRDILITGLIPSTTYSYRFRAVDQSNNETIGTLRHWTTAAAPDVTAPVISNDGAASTAPTSVTFVWTTDEAADSQVEYGADTGYGSSTTLDPNLVTAHSVSLGGLSAGQTLHYRVKSRDASGNLATGNDRTITTAEEAPTAWTDSDPPSGTTTTTMATIVSERSIGCDVTFTEGAVTLVAVTAEFRLADGSNRRDALDFWPTRPTSGNKTVYGSILDLTPGGSYQVRARLFWSDGTSSYRVASATLRTVSIPLTTTLTPTKFVDPVNGNDAWNGKAAAFVSGTTGPWKTFNKAALSCAANDNVEFLSNGNRVYLMSDGTSPVQRSNVTFYTDAPVVDDTHATEIGGQSVEITTGGRVTIEPPAVTAPSGYVKGTMDDHVAVAPWVQMTGGSAITGPGEHGATPASYTNIWRWTGCPVSTPLHGAYATTRHGTPQRLANWFPQGNLYDPDIDTLPQWAEVVNNTNLLYRYGFWPDPASPTTIYARLPGDLDPNTLWLWFGKHIAFDVRSAGTNMRISGFSIHTAHYLIQVAGASSGGAGRGHIIDRCLLQTAFNGVRNNGAPDVTIERNIWRDTNLWAEQTALSWDTTVIPWRGIKEVMLFADGSSSTRSKNLGWAESTAFYISSSGRKTTIRYNSILEGFNGIGNVGAAANTALRTWSDNCDVYRNYIQHLSDDAFEPEQSVINMRIWENTIRECLVVLSMAPVHFGPIYAWRNTGWEIGSLGTGRSVDGAVRPAGKFIKFDNSSQPAARVYLIHNTSDIDQTDPNAVMFAGDSGGGSVRHEKFWLKNNILTATSYIIDSQEISPAGSYVEDYNFLCTTDTSRGIRLRAAEGTGALTDYENTGGGTDFAAYRAASGQGAHSNLIDAVTKELNAADWLADVRAMWTDRDTGDLTLVSGAQAINRGVVVPNISDVPGVSYLGAAPDLGALERE